MNVICSKCDAVFHLQKDCNAGACKRCGTMTDKNGDTVDPSTLICSGSAGPYDWLNSAGIRPPRR